MFCIHAFAFKISLYHNFSSKIFFIIQNKCIHFIVVVNNALHRVCIACIHYLQINGKPKLKNLHCEVSRQKKSFSSVLLFYDLKLGLF